MATFLLRVSLPDRPGALGAVASRIGAVRADVIAIDILGRAEGRAIDEFVVEIDDDQHLPLLLGEIAEVDGVTVEELHPVTGHPGDRRLDAYDTAIELLEQRTPSRVLEVVARRARAELGAAWAALIDTDEIVARDGRPPAHPWIAAHVAACRVSPQTLSDVGWVDLPSWDLVLAAGRPGRPLGDNDRARLAAIGRLADARWAELAARAARRSHPSSHAG